MNVWRWWWCWLLLLQLVKAEEIAVTDEEHLKERASTENKKENHQTRERRDTEWSDGILPISEDEDIEESYPLLKPVKRNPLLSRWGGKRLSDFFYYKRKPAFSSWGGKRGPAFSSWGGKRSGKTNIDEENKRTYNATNNLLINEKKIPNGYTRSEYENNFRFPNEDNFYKTFQNGYFDNLSKEDQEILGRTFNTQEDPQILMPNEENFNLQNLNASFTRSRINNSDRLLYNSLLKSNPNELRGYGIYHYENNNEPEEEDNEDIIDNLDDTADIDEDERIGDLISEDGKYSQSKIIDKKAAPSFNSWGGKRAPAFNSWGGKREPAFKSWGGKRAPAFNSWGGKRAPAFNSWGGKRAPAFNSWGGKRDLDYNNWGGKRVPAFNSWGGKRAPAFNSWEGKRAPAFNSWGGKRAPAFNSWGGKRAPAFNSWGGKRAPAFNSWGGKRAPAFNSWGGKRDIDYNNWEEISEEKSETPIATSRRKRLAIFNNGEEERDLHLENLNKKRATAFNSWGGKRDSDFGNLIDKRAPAFNSWGGKRDDDQRNFETNNMDKKRDPAFNSWGGKRALAFNSWGGKRSPAFNSWGGKRAPAFNSWGGKRAPAFNSWGGKRVPAFNSWGGKRALAFNSWGGKRAPAFNSWGGKRAPIFTSWGRKRIIDDDIDNKISTIRSWTGKRLPAFHSWGGKRSDPLDLKDNENVFLDFYNSDNPLEFNSERSKNNVNPLITTEFIRDIENNISDENNNAKPKHNENKESVLDYDNLKPIENISDKVNNETPVKTENDHISISKRDTEGKRNPAFFSWGGKRSETNKQLHFLQNERSAERDESTTLKKIDNLFDNKGITEGNEIHDINKRNAGFSYNSDYLPNYMTSDYEGNSDYTTWNGKYNDRSFENINEGTNQGLTFNARKKRNVANDAKKLNTLITDNNYLDNTINSDFDSLSSENIYPGEPTGTIMCCIKRVQYGDRNLFMQMLLRTKSFRDLSWPTIRPIRRGSDFYSWGGKRSSL